MAGTMPWWIPMSLERTAFNVKSRKMLKNGPQTIEEGSVHPSTTFTANNLIQPCDTGLKFNIVSGCQHAVVVSHVSQNDHKSREIS